MLSLFFRYITKTKLTTLNFLGQYITIFKSQSKKLEEIS